MASSRAGQASAGIVQGLITHWQALGRSKLLSIGDALCHQPIEMGGAFLTVKLYFFQRRMRSTGAGQEIVHRLDSVLDAQRLLQSGAATGVNRLRRSPVP